MLTPTYVFLLIGLAQFSLVAVTFWSGAVAAQGGVVKRSECPAGYWILVAAHGAIGLTTIMFGALL